MCRHTAHECQKLADSVQKPTQHAPYCDLNHSARQHKMVWSPFDGNIHYSAKSIRPVMGLIKSTIFCLHLDSFST